MLAVGGGSARPPRLVRLTHKPRRSKAKVALVGKGITFDSGGLNIKTANMGWMKSDMGGAAAALVSVLAARRAEPAGRGDRDRADGREHAVGHGVPARATC